jgi:Carboxypeptidase regulatory-like domain
MKHLVASLISIILVTGVGFTDVASGSLSQAKFKSGIAGRLTDPNGAVIVGATVRIVARSTKKLVSFKTDDKGEYTADLEPDAYDVEADAAGFKKARRKSIPVQREARSFVDFMLEPGPRNDAQHP